MSSAPLQWTSFLDTEQDLTKKEKKRKEKNDWKYKKAEKQMRSWSMLFIVNRFNRQLHDSWLLLNTILSPAFLKEITVILKLFQINVFLYIS